jgi:hypothetical protein
MLLSSRPPPPLLNLTLLQVCIVPVSEKFIDYANTVRDRIHGAGWAAMPPTPPRAGLLYDVTKYRL